MNRFLKALTKYLQVITVFLEKRIQRSAQGRNEPMNTLAPKVLTDKTDLERIKPYLDSLKLAIDTLGINNIAVTGSYGSGKSTIIKTFQNHNPHYKYLNISLASFKDNQEGTSDDEAFERKLEISILQQMFYHVKPSVIPDSRFKRIVNITPAKLFWLTGFLILWIFSTLILVKFGYIQKLDPSTWKFRYQLDWVTFFSSTVFVVGIGLFIKNAYRLLINSKINKLNIKGELELGAAVDKSVFNQHLEEILYFFERTTFNVVVIEDVDRFNSTDIFTKLREINILINNSDLIGRSVKFVYAIKDEMFTDKNERVKFFEFIIPIIPFINPSNAGDQLAKLITSANLEGVLSPDFTSDVVTFIDDIDMRLLINIFQEYQVYKNILSSSLSQDNLFAMLVYKNLYPNDFGELSKRKGKLYKFLTDKQTYIKDIKEEAIAQIVKIDGQISLLEKESSINVKELRAVYINNLIAKLPGFYCLYYEKDITVLDALEDKFFDKIKKANDIMYRKYYVYYSSNYNLSEPVKSGVAFSSIEQQVSTALTYDQREQLLQDRANNQIDFLKTEKDRIKTRVAELDVLSIQEIFSLIDIGGFLGEFQDSYLMRNLLLNGYIDEHFDDYISLFHEVRLTKGDFSFERSIKGGVSCQFDYQLTNTENVIKKLHEKYFKREIILNFSILECLLDNEKKYKPKLEAIYRVLAVDDDRQFQFIHSFIKRKPKKIAEFVQKLCAAKPGLWSYIINKSALPDDEIRHLIRLIFEHADISAVLKFDNLNSLVKYFEQVQNLFSFVESFKDTNNIQKFISNQKLRFKSLDLPVNEKNPFFEFIYTKNHYHINDHNILVIIQANKQDYNLQEFNSSNYTAILKLDLPQLKDYLNVNIEEYISNVLTLLKDNSNESEETILGILNREDVSISLKEKVLKSQKTLIQSISDIDTIDVKRLALSNNKIIPNWKNVFVYHDAVAEEELDDTLIAFFNDFVNYEPLSKTRLNKGTDKEDDYIQEMSRKLLYAKHLDLEAYSYLLDSIPYVYNSLNLDNLDLSKLNRLLDKRKLTLTEKSFKDTKARNPQLSLKLIETHQSKFIENFGELELEAFDWLLIFKSSAITLPHKLSLVQKIDDSIIINSKSIADIVFNILPTDKLIPLRYEVLNAIFDSNNSVQKRIEILNLHFVNLDGSQIQTLIEKLGEGYKKIFMKQHKPVFAYKNFNIELFNKLQERGLIIRYELENKNASIRVYAKYQ